MIGKQEKLEVLRKYYGYHEFRDGQEVLIDSILQGKDTLGIMPTGAGKSICYQVPALLLAGITLVISPLISLMKDQVSALNQVGIHAAFLNSSLTFTQYRKALQYAKEGRYKIIYVAPERLITEEFLDFAQSVTISMVSVDEAHCVSQWGQDFRPSYLKIIEFVQKLAVRPIVSAFTATATKTVKEDMIHILRLKEPTILVTGFDRSNLYFSVQRTKDKYAVVRQYIEKHIQKSGIIYCLTRKIVEEVCEKLEEEGVAVTRYHAGLSDRERKQNQEDFIYDRKPIMVATNAFGMGIDKSNVDFVIHYNMPKNIESYYQEAGRAGRDGQPAECILLYAGQDVVTNQFFIENNQENEELDYQTLEIVKERDRERLKKMTFYCLTNECLRNYILRYFGEYGENYCGHCSNCDTQFDTIDITKIAENIISCIYESRQRFGVNVILDTVHGSKAAKITQTKMNENSYYNSLSNISLSQLRQVLNHLMLQNYVFLTNTEYPILQLTSKSKAILEKRETIYMKMAKEWNYQAEPKKPKKKTQKESIDYSEVNQELFQMIRQIRNRLAQQEKVPPYLIFADKTLIDMCGKMPSNKEEMLNVSGVGEAKFKKYGDIFLDVIQTYKREH